MCTFLCSLQLFLKKYKKNSTRYYDKCTQVVIYVPVILEFSRYVFEKYI